MRLLLDTHVFIWWLDDNPRLSEAARTEISAPSSSVWISPVSIWEISIKKALGKLQLDTGDLVQEIEENGFIELPISARHAAAAGNLPRHHADPFDRMLIAQAQIEELVLVSHDSAFDSYDLKMLKT